MMNQKSKVFNRAGLLYIDAGRTEAGAATLASSPSAVPTPELWERMAQQRRASLGKVRL